MMKASSNERCHFGHFCFCCLTNGNFQPQQLFSKLVNMLSAGAHEATSAEPLAFHFRAHLITFEEERSLCALSLHLEIQVL